MYFIMKDCNNDVETWAETNSSPGCVYGGSVSEGWPNKLYWEVSIADGEAENEFRRLFGHLIDERKTAVYAFEEQQAQRARSAMHARKAAVAKKKIEAFMQELVS